LIGVVATLAHLGRIQPGRHTIETPAGAVATELHADSSVSIENVLSFRRRKDVRLEIASAGTVRGDVAWGGNWFFLTDAAPCPLDITNVKPLTDFCWSIRRALTADGITGDDGAEIDHIELSGPPTRHDADARNFVLCPGGAYDRSPCGTGTSAKLASL